MSLLWKINTSKLVNLANILFSYLIADLSRHKNINYVKKDNLSQISSSSIYLEINCHINVILYMYCM